jgi:hypothetical protein
MKKEMEEISNRGKVIFHRYWDKDKSVGIT